MFDLAIYRLPIIPRIGVYGRQRPAFTTAMLADTALALFDDDDIGNSICSTS